MESIAHHQSSTEMEQRALARAVARVLACGTTQGKRVSVAHGTGRRTGGHLREPPALVKRIHRATKQARMYHGAALGGLGVVDIREDLSAVTYHRYVGALKLNRKRVKMPSKGLIATFVCT